MLGRNGSATPNHTCAYQHTQAYKPWTWVGGPPPTHNKWQSMLEKRPRKMWHTSERIVSLVYVSSTNVDSAPCPIVSSPSCLNGASMSCTLSIHLPYDLVFASSLSCFSFRVMHIENDHQSPHFALIDVSCNRGGMGSPSIILIQVILLVKRFKLKHLFLGSFGPFFCFSNVCS